MNFNQPELLRLLELLGTSNKLMKKAPSRCSKEYFEFNENLFFKLSVEFAKKAIEQAPFTKQDPVTCFDTSTARTCKLLHVKEGELRVSREIGKLKKGYHYTDGKSPRPSAIWYDIEATCQEIHEVSWDKFSQPGFDIEANTRERVSKAFAKARKGAKK